MERCMVEILYVTEGERDVNEQSIEAQRVHLRNCNTVDQWHSRKRRTLGPPPTQNGPPPCTNTQPVLPVNAEVSIAYTQEPACKELTCCSWRCSSRPQGFHAQNTHTVCQFDVAEILKGNKTVDWRKAHPYTDGMDSPPAHKRKEKMC